MRKKGTLEDWERISIKMAMLITTWHSLIDEIYTTLGVRYNGYQLQEEILKLKSKLYDRMLKDIPNNPEFTDHFLDYWR